MLKNNKIKINDSTCCFKTLQNTQINYKKQIKKYPQQYNNVGRPTEEALKKKAVLHSTALRLQISGFQ